MVIAGLVMGLVVGLMVRWSLVREVQEAKRYEVWGRKVEQRIDRCLP